MGFYILKSAGIKRSGTKIFRLKVYLAAVVLADTVGIGHYRCEVMKMAIDEQRSTILTFGSTVTDL